MLENELVQKQLKQVRMKKTSAATKAKQSSGRSQRVLDESQKKEVCIRMYCSFSIEVISVGVRQIQLMELQEQGNKLMKDLRQVNARLNACQRELRANEVTTQQIVSLSPDITTYRTVGKAFMLTPRSEIDRRLATEHETLSKNQADLSDRKLYLERRVESNAQHMKDLMGA